MRHFWLLIAGFTGLLAGCSSSGPLHQPAELQPLIAELEVERQWVVATPSSDADEVYGRLGSVVDGDLLYTLSAEGVVMAVDTLTQKTFWESDLTTVISGGLGINDELLFVGSADAEVIALNREDGQVKWRSRVASEVLATPVATESYVIARCGDGRIYALNSETGLILWQFQSNVPALTLRGSGTPVIVDDVVLLGTAEGRLLAVSIFNGDILWEVAIATPQGRTDLERMVDVDATPLVADGVVYASAYQGEVVALVLDTGRVLWRRDIGSAPGMTLDERNIYVVADDAHVWAFDRRSGATLWKQDALEYRSLIAPVVFDGALVVADFEGYLHWLSLDDGHLLARYQVADDAIKSAIQVKGGVAYVRNTLGRVEALRAQNVK